MNTNLLRTSMFALACGLLTSACNGGVVPSLPPAQTTGPYPMPQVVTSGVTELSEPVSVARTYDQCASGSSLRIQVQDTNFQSLTSEVKLTVTFKGSVEAKAMDAFKATLEGSLADDYKSSIVDGITHMEGVAFDVKEHTKSEVTFHFKKIKLIGIAESQGVSGDFRFRARIEYVGMESRDVQCPTAQPGTDTITVTPPPQIALTPTITPLPTATPCAVSIGSGLRDRLRRDAALRAALGCPIYPPRGVGLVKQHFQNGIMFWRDDTRKIYVLYNEGTWRVYDDTWDESQPEGGHFTPPPGLSEPKRGFGKVWRDQLGGLNAAIGWGIEEEASVPAMQVQEFENGLAFFNTHGEGFILQRDGVWK